MQTPLKRLARRAGALVVLASLGAPPEWRTR